MQILFKLTAMSMAGVIKYNKETNLVSSYIDLSKKKKKNASISTCINNSIAIPNFLKQYTNIFLFFTFSMCINIGGPKSEKRKLKISKTLSMLLCFTIFLDLNKK